jgi:hypothetical protein
VSPHGVDPEHPKMDFIVAGRIADVCTGDPHHVF